MGSSLYHPLVTRIDVIFRPGEGREQDGVVLNASEPGGVLVLRALTETSPARRTDTRRSRPYRARTDRLTLLTIGLFLYALAPDRFRSNTIINL